MAFCRTTPGILLRRQGAVNIELGLENLYRGGWSC